MKQYSATLLSAVLILASSCEDNINKGTVWDNPNFLRITVSTEDLTETGTKLAVNWNETDSIRVFDNESRGVNIGTNDPAQNIFFTYAWTAAKPVFAAYPADRVSSCTSEGIVSLTLDSEQTINSFNKPGPVLSAGKVTGNNTAYKLSPMSNAIGQLKLTMFEDGADYIKVEAVGGEILAGGMEVDIPKLDKGEENFWSHGSGMQLSNSVTIRPSAGSECITETGSMKAGTYYVSIFPQHYSEGLRITVARNEGDPIIRMLGSEGGITVDRSGIVTFDGALDDTLPEEIVINLDFYNEEDNNPLGTFVATTEQTTDGEEYIYRYEYDVDGINMHEDLSFIISKGGETGASYQFTTVSGLGHKVYFNSKNYGWIKLPGIKGRFLKSVSMSHGNNTATKRFRIQEKPASAAAQAGKTYSSPLVKAPSATEPGVTEVTFPTSNSTMGNLVNTTEGQSYYMMFTSGASLRIFNIKLVYTKTLE